MGRPPSSQWHCRPGCPHNRWVGQIRSDNNLPPAHLWRCAVSRGHCGATLQPLPAKWWQQWTVLTAVPQSDWKRHAVESKPLNLPNAHLRVFWILDITEQFDFLMLLLCVWTYMQTEWECLYVSSSSHTRWLQSVTSRAPIDVPISRESSASHIWEYVIEQHIQCAITNAHSGAT